jgi:ABC-type nitrate/sulfonate/bicarbonate transport system substrate-binding protein
MKKWLLATGHHHLFHMVAAIVARERGYFDAEGAGDCDFLATGSDAKTIEGMKAGLYQVGLDPKPFLLLESKTKGADFFIVGGFLNSPAYAFMARKGIKALTDLEGRKVSVREPDGIDCRFTRQVFRRQGLDADRMVQWVCNGSPSRRFQQPLFDSGAIDAAMVIQRDVPGMIKDGYPMLADLNDVYPHGYAVRVTAVRGDLAREEPDRLTALLRALIRAYRFMNQDYAKTMAILTRAGYKLDKDMDASLWEGKYHMFERIPLDGAVGVQGLEQVIEEEKAAGKLPENFAVKDILLDRFVKAAAASVDRRFGAGSDPNALMAGERAVGRK